MSTLRMYDSVTPSAIPLNAPAVAGYVGGRFPSFSQIVARCPRARHKSIAVNAGEDADILDVENGDAVPSDAPAWFRRQKARGVTKPGLYSSESEFDSVIAAMSAAGIVESEYVRWQAHFDNLPVLPFGFQAKQFIDHGTQGENYDISVCDDSFWGQTVPAVNVPNYSLFDGTTRNELGRTVNERSLVERYDRLRKHGVLNGLRLAPVRRDLVIVANRVERLAYQLGNQGRPNWKLNHLGYRRQQLVHRAQGQRFV
jgi:hypothetical protein